MKSLGSFFWATGITLLAAVTACGADGSDPPSAPESSAASSPSDPATSTAPNSPTEAARSDATSVVRSYFTVVDHLRSRPAADLMKLKSVATSAQLTAIQTLIGRQRDQGQRQTGKTGISELTVQTVNLDNSDPDAGRVPTVIIDVCWDVTKVDVLDESGKSIVSPDRPETGWTRYTVANYKYAADPAGGWRVATGQDLRQTPCTAS